MDRDIGAALLEYGLLITGIAAVVAAAVTVFGADVARLFDVVIGG